MKERVRMRHPSLPGREISAWPSPARLAAGWRPVDEPAERAIAAPAHTSTTGEALAAASADTEPPRRRRRASNEGTDS